MTSSAPPAPLVSVGIPLYRARPFVDRIVENIESIDYPNLEFVIADQHGLDDAVTVLKDRLRGDDRVRFFETTDELDWIDNYSFVLRQSRGKYFRLLAQDDVIPPPIIASAVARLEADSGVVIVDGPEDLIDRDGSVTRSGADPPAALRGRRFDALALFSGWRHGAANLGLVRRSVVESHDLYFPRTKGETGLSMRAWLFSLALRGAVLTLPSYRNRRCVHPDAFTTLHWERTAGQQIARLVSYVRVGVRLWNESAPGPFARVWGPCVVALAGGILLPVLRVAQRWRRAGSGRQRSLE